MNQRLLPWLQERKGKRFGIISKIFTLTLRTFQPDASLVLDFYDAVPGLVEAVIGL